MLSRPTRSRYQHLSMTTSPRYNLLVPRFDRTGPCNVAVDIGREAKRRGYSVRMLALSGGNTRDDLDEFDEVRLFRWRDLVSLRGVLHTHCLRPDLIGGLVALMGRCQVVTTLHNYFLIDLGFDHRRWQVAISWQLWRRAVAAMDHAVCISHAMQRYYRRKLPGATLSTAYNFRAPPEPAGQAPRADMAARFTPWIEEQRRRGRRVLAFVGGIHRRKNVLGLMAALATREDVALVFCGDGNQIEELRAGIVRQRCEERMLVLGAIARPDLVLAEVDALVLPSFAEGMPLVVLEAARLDKPALMSNIAVHREMAALGLGTTFDHRRFRDLDQALGTVTPCGSRQGAVRRIWDAEFTPEVGFARYEHLLGNSATLRPEQGRAS
ncbi:MAG: glycosyltransferase [Burkholderiales bacterium]|nr:MAG: glycosyltransferase [Burkholderiales bacterium]